MAHCVRPTTRGFRVNDKVYVHEFIDVIGHHRAEYIDHMAAFVPQARINKGMRCVGLWGTIGTTDRWPEAVNLWELDGWHGLAYSLDHETQDSSLQDKDVAEWWARAAPMRSGGFDRCLVASSYSPTLEQLIERGIKGHIYYHSMISTRPGDSPKVIDLIGEKLDVTAQAGLTLVGAYRTALCNDSEVLVIYGMPSWAAWADFEEGWAADGALGKFRRELASAAIDWNAKILRPGPLCPLNIGEIR